MKKRAWMMVAIIGLATPAWSAPPPAAPKVVSSIALSKPFDTRRAWTFTATQGADVADPIIDSDEKLPGAITLCLSSDGGRTCAAVLSDAYHKQTDDDLFDEPHFLARATIEHLPGPAARPFLFVRTESMPSTDGNARVVTQLLVYNHARDVFTLAYQHVSGHNNSEDLRYVAGGPLAGALIVAEPTQNAPYGFWVMVNRLTAHDTFEPALHYRSATRYGDGNPLSVIDSEMPDLEQHLGLWHPGQALPLPATPCARPHLVKGALWCE